MTPKRILFSPVFLEIKIRKEKFNPFGLPGDQFCICHNLEHSTQIVEIFLIHTELPEQITQKGVI